MRRRSGGFAEAPPEKTYSFVLFSKLKPGAERPLTGDAGSGE